MANDEGPTGMQNTSAIAIRISVTLLNDLLPIIKTPFWFNDQLLVVLYHSALLLNINTLEALYKKIVIKRPSLQIIISVAGGLYKLAIFFRFFVLFPLGDKRLVYVLIEVLSRLIEFLNWILLGFPSEEGIALALGHLGPQFDRLV